MKTCSRCKLQKPPESFNRERRKADGLSAWCKACKTAANFERRVSKLAHDEDWKLWRRTSARLTALVKQGVVVKPKTCPVCGATHDDTREMQASFSDPADPMTVSWACRTCRLKQAGRTVIVNCAWCLEPFRAQRASIRRKSGRYCGMQCRNAWMRSTGEHVHSVPLSNRSTAEVVYLDDRF